MAANSFRAASPFVKGCHINAGIGVFGIDDREEPRLPQQSHLKDEERELITSLYPALRKIAAVAGSVDIEPDDLVQEALVRTLRKGAISDLDNPLAYLRKAIVNLASNQRRSLGRRRRAEARLSAEDGWFPSYPADIEAILDLPPKHRAILYLVEVEDVPYAEAAQLLGMTTMAARATASRARRLARQALEVAGG
jgi:RNA polymerase sigma-70 factor (ECF subfamily)